MTDDDVDVIVQVVSPVETIVQVPVAVETVVVETGVGAVSADQVGYDGTDTTFLQDTVDVQAALTALDFAATGAIGHFAQYGNRSEPFTVTVADFNRLLTAADYVEADADFNPGTGTNRVPVMGFDGIFHFPIAATAMIHSTVTATFADPPPDGVPAIDIICSANIPSVFPFAVSVEQFTGVGNGSDTSLDVDRYQFVAIPAGEVIGPVVVTNLSDADAEFSSVQLTITVIAGG